MASIRSRLCLSVGSTALAAAVLLTGAAAADTLDAVTTPGSGTLTMCRNWLVYNSCTSYNKVTLPEQVVVGDRLKLTYGSNPKDYTFHVARIRRQGSDCTIYSDASGAGEDGERLEIPRCGAATTLPTQTSRSKP
jgi:hypothetical protein